MDSILLPWVIASTLLLFIAVYWIYGLEKRLKQMEGRYRRILTLSEGTDQLTIFDLVGKLTKLEGRVDETEGVLGYIQAVLPHTVQGYGMVRYQAFPNIGGDQSFSLALVDVSGNGVVLSGLHGRETRVYAKPLQQWRSSYSLSAEEQEALGQARQMLVVA